MINERLWDVPATWEWTSLRNLGDIVGGGTPSTKEPRYWGGEINWITPADLTGYARKTIARGAKRLSKAGLDNSSAKLMPQGAVHFSSRAPIGYVVIAAAPLCTNQGFKSLVPAEGVSSDYIYYYLKSATELARQRASGTTFLELSGAAFGALPIPVAPRNEQQRIVAKMEELFSELDKGVEALAASRKQLKAYRQSLLKHAFEGKLTQDWRARSLPQKHEVMGNAAIPEELAGYCTDHWAWLRLGDISAVTGGLTKNAKRSALPIAMKYLRVANVYADRLELGDVAEMGVTEEEFDNVRLQAGDMLVVEGNGSLEQIGRVALWGDEMPEVGHQNHLIRVRFTPEMSPRFFLLFLMSPLGRDLIVRQASSTSGLHTLSISKVSGLPVPIPTAAEQAALLAALDVPMSEIERLDEEIEAGVARCSALKHSILEQAFSGRLVPQDAEDESASAMLDRIRDARDGTSMNTRRATRNGRKKAA